MIAFEDEKDLLAKTDSSAGVSQGIAPVVEEWREVSHVQRTFFSLQPAVPGQCSNGYS